MDIVKRITELLESSQDYPRNGWKPRQGVREKGRYDHDDGYVLWLDKNIKHKKSGRLVTGTSYNWYVNIYDQNKNLVFNKKLSGTTNSNLTTEQREKAVKWVKKNLNIESPTWRY